MTIEYTAWQFSQATNHGIPNFPYNALPETIEHRCTTCSYCHRGEQNKMHLVSRDDELAVFKCDCGEMEEVKAVNLSALRSMQKRIDELGQELRVSKEHEREKNAVIERLSAEVCELQRTGEPV